MKRFIFLLFLTSLIFLFLNLKLKSNNSNTFAQTLTPTPTENSWPMAGANPQRTSWTPEEIRGNVHALWYRAIEPYIAPYTQLVAANNTIFISTAKGLYALDEANGNQRWLFPTDLPLGNSPTIYNGVAYVGGMDHKLYAINISSGGLLWSFEPGIDSTADIGEAAAGFDTNPLVVNNIVYLGNRNGYFYAIYDNDHAQKGQLAWKYKTDQNIPFSAAASTDNLEVYFASNNGHAYALNALTGTLIWQSQELPGLGFRNWWPVVYQDKVIFAGTAMYRTNIPPEVNQEPTDLQNQDGYDLFNSLSNGSRWSTGQQIANYFNDIRFQNRRTYFVLNRSDGSEYKFNVGGTSYYAPFAWFGTRAGSRYPPIVVNNTLYQSNTYAKDQYGGTRGQIVGWNPGSMNFTFPSGNNTNASDEPISYSAGGNIIYYTLCCDRAGGSFPTDASAYWNFYNEGNGGVNNVAPNYKTQYWGDFAGQEYGLGVVYAGKYTQTSGSNGIYAGHADNNAMIPYKGKLFMQRSNTVIALSPNGTAGSALSTLPATTVTPINNPINTTNLKEKLVNEVQKIITAGHLRPAYSISGNADQMYRDDSLMDLWHNSSDTLTALSRAYPFLSASLKADVLVYLNSEYTNYNPMTIDHIGFAQGAAREPYIYPPDITNGFTGIGASYGSDVWTLYRFYALWKYAISDPTKLTTLWNDARNSLNTISTTCSNTDSYRCNAALAGFYGYAKLAQMANDSASYNNAISQFNSLCTTRYNNFSKDNPFGTDPNQYQRTYNIARNFMFMTKETADCLKANGTKIQSALNEYLYLEPFWFVSYFGATYGEGAIQPIYDQDGLFNAYAFVLQRPQEDLAKYLDVPAVQKGDMYYINHLVTVLEATPSGPTPSIGPTSTPGPTFTPTPTVIQIGNGDVNNDGKVDLLDLTEEFVNYGKNLGAPQDQYVDGKINMFDVINVIYKLSTSVPTPTPVASLLPGNPSDWTLTFSDEFNGLILDASKWSSKYAFDTGHGDRSNNDENEWYVNDAATLSNGILTLSAKHECLDSSRTENYSPYNCLTYPYTSGLISTHKSFAQKYGYFETRMNIPKGSGLWPAFWLLAQPSPLPLSEPWPDFYWPPEIDIMENTGNDTSHIFMTNHYSGTYPVPGSASNNWSYGGSNGGELTGTTDFSAGFHTYGVDWEPNLVIWYIDGIERARTTQYTPPGSLNPGAMYLILNLAVGGTTGGDPTGTTFPQFLKIDYVRVYQKNITSSPTPIYLTPSPSPTGLQTINFDSYSGGQTLTNEYPLGIINWGTLGSWSFDSGTWGGCTRSIWFTNNGTTSVPFTFVSPHTLISLTACNGGTTSSTVTASCTGNSMVSMNIPANSAQDLITNWVSPCSQITVTSSNSNDTNFDNIIFR